MKEITVCSLCNSTDIEYLGGAKCYCNKCKKVTESEDKIVCNPYERTRNLVYATGNKWAIENFNATH